MPTRTSENRFWDRGDEIVNEYLRNAPRRNFFSGEFDFRKLETLAPRLAQNFLTILVAILLTYCNVHANPYLPKPGEPPIAARVGTCSITGGFIHF